MLSMKLISMLSTLATAVSASIPLICSNDTRSLINHELGVCYTIYSTPLTYADATQYCADNGGRPALVARHRLRLKLKSFTTFVSDVWVALENGSGNWTWRESDSKSWPVAVVSWGTDGPQMAQNNAVLDLATTKFKSALATEMHPPLCEIDYSSNSQHQSYQFIAMNGRVDTRSDLPFLSVTNVTGVQQCAELCVAEPVMCAFFVYCAVLSACEGVIDGAGNMFKDAPGDQFQWFKRAN